MFQSILLMLSGLNGKVKFLSLLFLFINFLFTFNSVNNFSMLIINSIIFFAITAVIAKIQNHKFKKIFSVFSVIVYSVAVDLICFFVFPVNYTCHSLLEYIFNGIIFNCKFVLINYIVINLLQNILIREVNNG